MRERLDKILLGKGLVGDSEIREALLRQKVHGGRFGSALMYHRSIDEKGLVEALAAQLGCESVMLSEREIPAEVIGLIPAKVAVARRIVPFEHDRRLEVLKVACLDPTDHELVKELRFIVHGKQVELYVAAEIAVSTAIARYYMGRDTSIDANLLLEIPEDATRTAEVDSSAPGCDDTASGPQNSTTLIVTDEEYAAPLLEAILERCGHAAEIANTVDGVLEQIAAGNIRSVFIRKSMVEDKRVLADRVRKISPATHLRYFQDASSLILDAGQHRAEEILVSNLDMLTSLLVAKAGLKSNHSGRVGRYTARLCRKLHLQPDDTMLVTDAGYLHDVGRFYYDSEETDDHREAIDLSLKLLTSLDYSPGVLGILRSAYSDLDVHEGSGLPLEVLGASIITVVDLFCHAVPPEERLSLDKLDSVQKKLRALSGCLLLGDVVEIFIRMVREDILDVSRAGIELQLMIYNEDPATAQPLEMRLRNDGFHTVMAASVDEFVSLYDRSRPEVMVLALAGKPDKVTARVDELRRAGIGFAETPAFLLVEGKSIAGLTGLLSADIEDLVSTEQGLDVLASKINKLASRLMPVSSGTGEYSPDRGTTGRLSDMNLIDLLQALGPGQKTAVITVKNEIPDVGRLTIYLNQGRIVHSKIGDLEGAEAIYEALTWADGTWSVEPLAEDKIPEANTDQSNESILMEGCRLMDERIKTGHLL